MPNLTNKKVKKDNYIPELSNDLLNKYKQYIGTIFSPWIEGQDGEKEFVFRRMCISDSKLISINPTVFYEFDNGWFISFDNYEINLFLGESILDRDYEFKKDAMKELDLFMVKNFKVKFVSKKRYNKLKVFA